MGRLNRNHKAWTAEAVRMLRKLRSFGFSDAYIGEKLGRSANAIRCKRRRLGLREDEGVEHLASRLRAEISRRAARREQESN